MKCNTTFSVIREQHSVSEARKRWKEQSAPHIKKAAKESVDIDQIAPVLSDIPTEPVHYRRRWLTSLLLVLLVYGLPFIWWFIPAQQTVIDTPPPAAMVVELAPAPVAPKSQAELPPGPEQIEATPTVQQTPQPKPEPEPEIPPAPVIDNSEVMVSEKTESEPEEQPEPEELTPPEKPDQQPLEETTASTTSAAPDAAQQKDEAAAPTQSVAAPAINTDAILSWQNRLMVKLNESKRYPIRARRARQEGVTYLRFTMNRKGEVLAQKVEQSSGYSLLDEETLAMLERAQPLPEPPEAIAGQQLEFVIPVEFFLSN